MADIAKVFAHITNSPNQFFYKYHADFPESAITGDMTIQAWTRIDYANITGNNDLVVKHGWAGHYSYWLVIDAGYLRFTISTDGTALVDLISTAVIAEADTWLHVAVTYDASDGSAILYKNGAAISDDGTSLPNSIYSSASAVFSVGSSISANNLQGSICHVALFDDIRTPAEILYSYTYPKENLSTEGNIIAYWPFDDLSEDTVITNGQGDTDRDLIPYVTGTGATTYGDCGRTTGGTALPMQGFGIGRFGTVTFGQEAAQITVQDAAVATTVQARLVFAFKMVGGNMHYYDEYVIDAPMLSKGGDGLLSAGSIQITLDNTDQTWNVFRSTPGNIGQPAMIGMWFDTDAGRVPGILKLFTGTVEEVEYIEDTIVLTLIDKFAKALQRTIGDSDAPYMHSGLIAAGSPAGTIMWDFLTAGHDDSDSDWGNLDNAEHVGNQDIDWHSFQEWSFKCKAKSYFFRARIPGNTLQDVLSRMAELTNSVFWVNNIGKICFTMFDPDDDIPVTETCTALKSYRLDIDIDRKNIVNHCRIHVGYLYDDHWDLLGPIDMNESERWEGGWEEYGDTTSQNTYGVSKKIFTDKMLVHMNNTGALNFITDYVNLHKDENDRVKVTLPMYGFFLDIGGKVRVNEVLKGLTAVTGLTGSDDYIIDTVNGFDLSEGLAELEGRCVRFWGT